MLRQRSIPQAAGAAKIGIQTLYTWLRDPAFNADYLAAAAAVFGPAMMLVQNMRGEASRLVEDYSQDRTLPEQPRRQAARYVLAETLRLEKEAQEARVAAMEPAAASAVEPPAISSTSGTDLHQRLQRIKGLLGLHKQHRMRRIVAHAIDGRPAGTSERGPDGRHVWVDPPAGCRPGELVENPTGPVQDSAR